MYDPYNNKNLVLGFIIIVLLRPVRYISFLFFLLRDKYCFSNIFFHLRFKVPNNIKLFTYSENVTNKH